MKVKQEGDYMFYKEQMDEAMAKYESALEVDKENEYAIANIGVIHLKRAEYVQCVEHTSRALAVIEQF